MKAIKLRDRENHNSLDFLYYILLDTGYEEISSTAMNEVPSKSPNRREKRCQAICNALYHKAL